MKTLKKIMGRNEIPSLIAVLLLGLVFGLSSPNFLSAYNIYNLSRTAALYMFIALSQATVIIVGGMNLSLGFIGALTVVALGHSMQNWGVSTPVAWLIALAVGVICGLVNGLLIVNLRLNSFVVTLATSFIYKGLVTGISKGFPYTELRPDFSGLATGKLLGLPAMLYLAVGVLVAVWYFFKFTVQGRKLLATGGNETAARMAAVNTDLSVVVANTLSGLFAALGGICTVSMSTSAQPSTGQDWMIYSFAVAVIGGTSLKGGVINAVGIFIAAFLIVMIKNGLVMIHANYYYEQTYLGLILLFAVSLSTISTMIGNYKKKKDFLKSTHMEVLK